MSSIFNTDYDMQAWLRTCEEEIFEPLEGKLTGTFPNWLEGTLLRNGPGSLRVGSEEYKHVYDGSALLHRMSSFFNPLTNLTDNSAISVCPFGDQVYTITKVTNVYKIDPITLKTLEKKNLFDSFIVYHSAHPHVMSYGDVYNIGLRIEGGLVKNVIVKFLYTDKGGMFELAEVVNSMAPRWQFNPTYIYSFVEEKIYKNIIRPVVMYGSECWAMKIIKVDTKTGQVKTWHERYGNPSEPVYVSRPGSEDEDDGVVLSVVVWGDSEHAVTLVMLRASDFKKLRRAHFTTPSQATKCFHGWFLPL